MNEQTITDLETNNLTKYRTEVLELVRLCNLSRMPEKIGELIEQGVSVEQAREVLMELLAERTKKTDTECNTTEFRRRVDDTGSKKS